MDEIITESTVTVSGSNFTVQSRFSPTVTIDEDDSLRVYLATRDTNPIFWPMELSEQLSVYFGISEAEKMQLYAILASKDPESIEGFLERHGIPVVDIGTLEGYGAS